MKNSSAIYFTATFCVCVVVSLSNANIVNLFICSLPLGLPLPKQRCVTLKPKSTETGRVAVGSQHGDFITGLSFKLWSNKTE